MKGCNSNKEFQQSNYWGSGQLVKKSIKKYGIENHEKWTILHCENKYGNHYEIIWIKKLNTKIPNGYNLTDGGEGTLGHKPSKEKNKKHSEFMKKLFIDNPHYSNNLKEKYKIKCQNLEWRQKTNKKLKLGWTQEVRNKHSINLKIMFKDKDKHDKIFKNKREKYYDNLEWKKNQYNLKVEYYKNNPEIVKQRNISLKKYFEKPGIKEQHSEETKRGWITRKNKIYIKNCKRCNNIFEGNSLSRICRKCKEI
jgi:hypothetical protein